ncbi:MAG: UDP-4-amino-4,6-dideoxy-N-acetyl-beta-L-altrosamine transaminase [Myxococcales bacterium]|nr:UDP-4-amino-4,6-dideoxy-N-acetyl-beta-L-altrosamine transaminase [Myxococcales bacterium]
MTPGSARALPYGRQTIDDEDVAAVVAALRCDWLTQGPTVARFEQALAERCGAPYCVAVSSGTAALHLASMVGGVRPGTSGVTSDMTFAASANGLLYCGGAVALADVDPATALVTPATMRAAAAAAEAAGVPVRALVPVDYSGSVVDLPGMAALGRELGARVIEDAAHSLGATYTHEGRVYRAGSCEHSDFAILSFHPVKHITTVEGGAVLTRDEGAYRELLELRTHGITKDPSRMSKHDGPWYYEQVALGYHYRIGDVQCALGLSQLARLDQFLERRRQIVARYTAAISGGRLASVLEALAVPVGVATADHLYVVRVKRRSGESTAAVAARRFALHAALSADGIHAQVHYVPVHHHPVHRSAIRASELEGAEDHYARCLSLPLFPTLADADVDRVVQTLEQALLP